MLYQLSYASLIPSGYFPEWKHNVPKGFHNQGQSLKVSTAAMTAASRSVFNSNYASNAKCYDADSMNFSGNLRIPPVLYVTVFRVAMESYGTRTN